jgi:hypothetical protein
MVCRTRKFMDWHDEGTLHRNCSSKKEYNQAYYLLCQMEHITPKKRGTGTPPINEKGIPRDERLRRQRAYLKVWRSRNKGWNRACAARYQAKKKAAAMALRSAAEEAAAFN